VIHRIARWAITIIFILQSLFIPLQAASDYELPSIGQPVDTAISPLEEEEIGRDIVRQLRSFNYLMEDTELRYYVHALGTRLASYSGYSADGFDFFVVRDRQVNAFALPGGYIGINAGLILASRTEDELAGVFSHEIAHVTQRHIARQIEASGTFNIATIAALVVAILAGASDPDVAQAALSLGLASTQQMQINFTRTHEMEADRVGIRTLAESGYDPKGMASFFQQMEERARLYGSGLPEILQSHPVSNTRISEALNRAGDYSPEQIKHYDPLPYQLMRARTRVLTAPQASEALNFFTPEINDQKNYGARYGYSLALVRSGRYEDALKQLQALSGEINQPNVEIALARAQLATGEVETATTTMLNATRRFPHYVPLTLAYADLLVQSGEPEAARKVILASELANSSEPEVHRLLAVAARDLKRIAEAHYQMAEHHRLLGEYRDALNQLHAGLRNEKISETDKARLQQALNNLQKEVPERIQREIQRERKGERTPYTKVGNPLFQ